MSASPANSRLHPAPSPVWLWLWPLATLALTTCGSQTLAALDPAAEQFQKTAAAIDLHQLARVVHDKVNAVRVREQLAPVDWNAALGKIATGHSQNMVGHNYFAHQDRAGNQFLQRYERAGFSCKIPEEPPYYLLGAENLALVHRVAQWRVYADGRKEAAVVLTVDQIAEAAVQGWWDSEGHRRNMLTPQWQTEGIGIALTADGRFLITQNFC